MSQFQYEGKIHRHETDEVNSYFSQSLFYTGVHSHAIGTKELYHHVSALYIITFNAKYNWSTKTITQWMNKDVKTRKIF